MGGGVAGEARDGEGVLDTSRIDNAIAFCKQRLMK
jgi:hypothetical protein